MAVGDEGGVEAGCGLVADEPAGVVAVTNGGLDLGQGGEDVIVALGDDLADRADQLKSAARDLAEVVEAGRDRPPTGPQG